MKKSDVSKYEQAKADINRIIRKQPAIWESETVRTINEVLNDKIQKKGTAHMIGKIIGWILILLIGTVILSLAARGAWWIIAGAWL